MEWKEQYSVGIEEIDGQHKKLLSLFSAIEESVRSKRSTWQDVLYGIVALRGIARSHFEFEEGLMRLYGFSEFGAHEVSHRHFFLRLDEMAKKPHHESATNELVDFLIDWLTSHLLGADREYAKHILSGAPVVRSKPPGPLENILKFA